MPARRSRSANSITPPIEQLLLRARDVATLLGVGLTQVELWRRDGTLRAFNLPGLRAVRYSREEVESVARRWIAGELKPVDT